MSFTEIQFGAGNITARVSPERGALATSLVAGGVELLYLDRETFENPAINVRGGIPLLFPFAGSLADGTLNASMTKIPQHGFARNKRWAVQEQTEASLRLGLESDEESLALFPWRFRLEHSFTLIPRGMLIELLMINNGETPMPVAPGWHPYFNCAVSDKHQVAGNIAGTEAGKVHDRAEINYGVVPPSEGRVEYKLPGLGQLRLSFSPEMRHLQVWSIPGKPFVCIEPFTGPPNIINAPAARHVPPNAARSTWMRIECI